VRYYQITVEKIAYFDLRQVHLMSQFWVTLFEFYQDLWHHRVCVILLLAILLELWLVMDRQTDTLSHSIYHIKNMTRFETSSDIEQGLHLKQWLLKVDVARCRLNCTIHVQHQICSTAVKGMCTNYVFSCECVMSLCRSPSAGLNQIIIFHMSSCRGT